MQSIELAVEAGKILAELTASQREVLLAFNMTPSWTTAPKAGWHRRQGSVATNLAAKGLFEQRFEKANGLNWYRPTVLGHAVYAAAQGAAA